MQFSGARRARCPSAYGCLGSIREVVDGETDGGKCAPGARERVGVDGGIDGGGGGCWGTRKGEIMNGSIPTRFAWLEDPRERGRLEGTDE